MATRLAGGRGHAAEAHELRVAKRAHAVEVARARDVPFCVEADPDARDEVERVHVACQLRGCAREEAAAEGVEGVTNDGGGGADERGRLAAAGLEDCGHEGGEVLGGLGLLGGGGGGF